MLLLCPVRPGDTNEELRYAIRSWEANLHLGSPLTLWTVGYKPTWLNPDHHIEGNRFKSMPLAVFDNIRLISGEAVDKGLGDETAIYMNDDFFCLDPVGKILMVRRNCTLEQHIAKFPGNAGLWWPRSLRLTASWLDEQGFPHPDSYEVHRPLPAPPAHMFEALSRWNMDGQETVPQWRTVYGVLYGVEAHPVKDVKVEMRAPAVGTPWLSTSDQTWRKYAQSLRKRFQKPSRWEQ